MTGEVIWIHGAQLEQNFLRIKKLEWGKETEGGWNIHSNRSQVDVARCCRPLTTLSRDKVLVPALVGGELSLQLKDSLLC